MLPALAVQMRYQQATGKYWLGSATVGDLALSPVPSEFFPKPITARDDMLTRTFGTGCKTVAGGKCPDFSVVGTFYQDFGYAGALFGMFLLGLGSSAIWRAFRRSPSDPKAALLASAAAIFLPIMIRAGFMPPMAWVLYFVVRTWLGIRIASGRQMRYAIEMDGAPQPLSLAKHRRPTQPAIQGGVRDA